MGDRNTTILYIEDCPGDILLIRTAFIEFSRHIRFEVALDGHAAKRRLDHFAESADRPDLILLDLNLPSFTGIELLEYVHDIGLDIPVVVLTTSTYPPDRDRCMRLGCAAFLHKPMTYQAYREVVREIERILTAREAA
jgi:two-component system response regulator